MKEGHLEELKNLQDEGIETLIKVVEIKSDEEQDEATPAKEEYAKAHFERVSRKLSTLNLQILIANIEVMPSSIIPLICLHQINSTRAGLQI